jgi:predicted PurR-regulated permease PerM
VAGSLGVLAVALGALAVYTVRGIVVLAVVALFTAVSLDPAVRWLVRHGWQRSWAVTLIFLGTLVLVAGLIAATVPALVRQATSLAADLPGYIDAYIEQSRPVREFLERVGLSGQPQTIVKDLPGQIGANVLGFVSSVFGALFSALTVMVLTIYFMADLPRLRTGVVRLFPAGTRRHVRRTVDLTIDKVGSYMIGNLLISLVAGVTTFVALNVLGAPFALPLAFVVAITDLVPMIGATLGAVVCVGVTALVDDLWPTTVLVIAFFVAYQQLENYVIAPRILRNAVDLPALAVLLAGLVGGTVLGLVGALMAIPVAAVIRVLALPKLSEMDAAEAAAPPGGMVDGAEPGPGS